MKFPQRITFTGSIVVDAEGLDWKTAKEVVLDAMTEADSGSTIARLVRVTKLEIVERD